jgi:DNA-binding transcriptional MerR regulator
VNTEKSPDAFRTISEVADWLGTPAHVLRFWESRFPQIKPVKRAGGRRYYRPADMELLGGIKKLLHDDGMTIRGVQKLLRENGVRRVADLSPPLAADLADALSREREQSVDRPVERPPAAAPVAPDPQAPAPQAPAPLSPAPLSPAPRPDVAAPRDAGPAPAPSDWRTMSDGPDAPMAADMPPDAPEPAEVLPFVLSPRSRADAAPDNALDNALDSVPDSAPNPATVPAAAPPAPPPVARPPAETPDLFDRLLDTPRPTADSASDVAGPRLRLPAIPPDPTDADPLPGLGPRRPAIPRRLPHRPDDRLTLLFQRLAAVRGRMDRADP